MFSRNEKLGLAALAFCVFITGAMIPSSANWWVLTGDENNARYAEYYHSKCEAQNPIGLFAESQGVISAATKNHKKLPKEPKAKDKPDYPDYCDLAAQYVAARAAEASSYWAFLTFIATAVGVALLWLTLRETRSVTRVTREIGIEQTRAHLVIDSVMSINTYRSHSAGRRLCVSVKIRNVGATPCREIDPICNYISRNPGVKVCAAIQKIRALEPAGETDFMLEWGDLKAGDFEIEEIPVNTFGKEVLPELKLNIRYLTAFGYYTLKCTWISEPNAFHLGTMSRSDESDIPGFWTLDGREWKQEKRGST